MRASSRHCFWSVATSISPLTPWTRRSPGRSLAGIECGRWTHRPAGPTASRSTRCAVHNAVPRSNGASWRVRYPHPTYQRLPAVRGISCGRFPVRQRTAVVLRYVADMTESDIAEAMGITRGTVSSTLADARRRMAESVASETDELESNDV